MMLLLIKKLSYKWLIIGMAALIITLDIAISINQSFPKEATTIVKEVPHKEIIIEEQEEPILPLGKPSSDTYVVINNYFYRPNGETISESQLKEQIAQVKRIGGNLKVNLSGDSNFFSPPAPIYSISGINPDEKVAIKTPTKGSRRDPGYIFMILVRGSEA